MFYIFALITTHRPLPSLSLPLCSPSESLYVVVLVCDVPVCACVRACERASVCVCKSVDGG